MRTVLKMPISQLPNGFFKERLVPMVDLPEESSVFIVAKPGGNNDWAAYIGWPKYEDLTSKQRENVYAAHYCRIGLDPDQVESNGDKLSEDEARILFPIWADKKYRR